jgi:DNA-binding NarL/FixJ family response regulator
VVADDHALVRHALAAMLRGEGIVVVGEAGCADEAHALAAGGGFDVLLLDLCMDRNTLVDIAALSRKARVLVLSASEQPADALAAMRAGAAGFVCKRAAATQLVEAIRTVARGESWIPVERTRAAETGPHPIWPALTRREIEIVRQVARGLRSAEVAKHLTISEATVKTHLSNVFEKLGLRDRAGLTLYAIRSGIVSVGDDQIN